MFDVLRVVEVICEKGKRKGTTAQRLIRYDTFPLFQRHDTHTGGMYPLDIDLMVFCGALFSIQTSIDCRIPSRSRRSL